MPLELTEKDEGRILAVSVSGKLTKADYAPLAPAFDRLLARHEKIRLLFDMTGFHGWDTGAAWEDFKLAAQHHADIERLAMVGETKWQHAMATISLPFTKATVRYFDRSDADAAWKWIEEPSDKQSPERRGKREEEKPKGSGCPFPPERLNQA